MRKSNQKNKPVLRFKDEQGISYRNWKLRKLGDVANILSGGTPKTTEMSFWNGSINWFTPTEIDSKYSDNSIRRISKQGLKSSSAKLLPAGTILFTSRATIGRASIATQECTTNQGFQSFVVYPEKYSNEFIYYWIKNNKNEFVRKANGSTYLEVTNREIKKIKISCPCRAEQQKIASFLSSVDKKIEQLSRKKNLLEQYKKGMMQQLFNREIRFKDEHEKDYPNEVEKNLCELAEVIRGVTFNRGDAVEVAQTGRLPVLRAGNIGDELNLHQDLIWLPEKIISPAKLIKKQDILMCASSGSSLLVGKSAIVRQNWKGTVGAFCFIIRVNSSQCNSNYLAYFLKSSKFRKWTKIAEGTNIKNIRMSDLRYFLVPLPSFNEQQKIANFLSSVDTKIQQVSLQIELARKFKKGLLQQMFV